MAEEEAVAVQQRMFAESRARVYSSGAPVADTHATNSEDEEEEEEEEATGSDSDSSLY